MIGKNQKSQARKPRRQKGTLAIVGMLFLLSGVFRFATDAGQVWAEGTETPKAEVASTDSDASDLAKPDRLEHALTAIEAREARLVALEAEMTEREKSVEAAENAIRSELQKLQAAEESLRETITVASEAAENDLEQLTRVYASMKPKQAAALFEQMEASFAAGFLYRMPPENAARVMAGMTAEKAYLVSVELAGRNADIPLQ